MSTVLIPDPPPAVVAIGDDPPTRQGGIFDPRIFDNIVFDVGSIGARTIADPPLAIITTINP